VFLPANFSYELQKYMKINPFSCLWRGTKQEHRRKRVSPRFVLQSNHPRQPTIGVGAEAAQSRPKEMKEKIQKKKNADNGGSTKTTKPRDRCVHRRSPTKLRDSEAPVPINTSKKGRDDGDAAAKGFPRYTARREEG
jgi:hypothetical protein